MNFITILWILLFSSFSYWFQYFKGQKTDAYINIDDGTKSDQKDATISDILLASKSTKKLKKELYIKFYDSFGFHVVLILPWC